MSNYDRLTGLISSGEVELIHVEAVPRSISTALARALSESVGPSLYVNEPFNRMRHDFEDASMRILEAVGQMPTFDERPITIISKNMARNISTTIFNELLDLSKGVVWAIRDPQVQISSLLTRIANDLDYEPGADRLTQGDLSDEQIKRASDFLESGPKSTNFSKTSWLDIGLHHKQLRPDTVSVVVDGKRLTSEPESVLRSVAHSLGLGFSTRMVNGWEGKFINANTGYNPNLKDDTHAWTKDAVLSSGIHESSTRVLPLERMPESLRNHILNVAIPTYREMVDSV